MDSERAETTLWLACEACCCCIPKVRCTERAGIRAEVYQKRRKDKLYSKPTLLHAGYLNNEAKASE